VRIVDAERAGVIVQPGGFLGLGEGGWATVPVSLAAAPAADVVVPVRSTDPAEALVSAAGAAPAASLELTFTPESWNRAQPVTVWAVNDAVLEPGAPHPFALSVGPTRSASAPYDGVAGRIAFDSLGDVTDRPVFITVVREGRALLAGSL
jgi:hypothetical protein